MSLSYHIQALQVLLKTFSSLAIVIAERSSIFGQLENQSDYDSLLNNKKSILQAEEIQN